MEKTSMGNSSWGAGHHAGLNKGLQQGRLEGGSWVAAGALMVGGALWGYKKLKAHKVFSHDSRPGGTKTEVRRDPAPDERHPPENLSSN
jgi:hypothetical protein